MATETLEQEIKAPKRISGLKKAAGGLATLLLAGCVYIPISNDKDALYEFILSNGRSNQDLNELVEEDTKEVMKEFNELHDNYQAAHASGDPDADGILKEARETEQLALRYVREDIQAYRIRRERSSSHSMISSSMPSFGNYRPTIVGTPLPRSPHSVPYDNLGDLMDNRRRININDATRGSGRGRGRGGGR